MAKRYFEDFEPGRTFDLGSRTVDREEIIEFASRYDPQPFHIDEEAARHSIYGGLIASGWHTAAMSMRLFVEGLVGDSSSFGSPGIDEIRWLRPVRPGDTLSLHVKVMRAEPSRSKPDRGSVWMRQELRNQAGEVVMHFVGIGIYGKRPTS